MENVQRLFGSGVRSQTLLSIAALGETYPTEIAKMLGVPLISVQRIVDDLEIQGIVATRLFGTQRRTTLNPRWYAITELRALLLRLVEGDADLRARLETIRRRPRRRGKTLGDSTRLDTR